MTLSRHSERQCNKPAFPYFTRLLIKYLFHFCHCHHNHYRCYYFMRTFPPMMIQAGRPRTTPSLANCVPHLWQFGAVPSVKSLTTRSLKHLTSLPLLAPFALAYLNSLSPQHVHRTSTVRRGMRLQLPLASHVLLFFFFFFFFDSFSLSNPDKL